MHGVRRLLDKRRTSATGSEWCPRGPITSIPPFHFSSLSLPIVHASATMRSCSRDGKGCCRRLQYVRSAPALAPALSRTSTSTSTSTNTNGSGSGSTGTSSAVTSSVGVVLLCFRGTTALQHGGSAARKRGEASTQRQRSLVSACLGGNLALRHLDFKCFGLELIVELIVAFLFK